MPGALRCCRKIPTHSRALFIATIWQTTTATRRSRRSAILPAQEDSMRKVIAILILAAATVLASAQTKVAGTIECGKPDTQQAIQIPDKAGHAFTIAQQKCTWSKPMEFNGVKTKDVVFTASSE